MMVKESAKNCVAIIQSFSLANKPAAVPELVGLNPPRGGGGVLPYISHIGTFYPKGVFGLFWSENGCTDFAHFGLESGMVFEETTGVYECIYHFNSK